MLQATKKMELYMAPEVLVVQLNRFAAGFHQPQCKLDDMVTYPLAGLDLSQFVQRDQVTSCH
jgi:ubiquitin C-terminal hydrolase